MKKLITLTFLFVVTIAASAQNAAQVMLFPEFQKGIIYVRSGISVTQINYDVANQILLYMQDGKQMQATNVENLDSIVVDKRVFVPMKGKSHLAEKVRAGKHTLLVDWKINVIDEGYRNAYGQVTHQARSQSGKVYQITSDTGKREDATDADPHVVRQQDFSQLFLLRDGKALKFKDKKSFMKLFAGQEDAIEAYLKDNSTNFLKYQQVLPLLEILK